MYIPIKKITSIFIQQHTAADPCVYDIVVTYTVCFCVDSRSARYKNQLSHLVYPANTDTPILQMTHRRGIKVLLLYICHLSIPQEQPLYIYFPYNSEHPSNKQSGENKKALVLKQLVYLSPGPFD